MSTGNINLDLLLDFIKNDYVSNSDEAVKKILKRYPKLSEDEAREIRTLVTSSMSINHDETKLVVTAPPSFSIKGKPTKIVVKSIIENANRSILITGYSLSNYFNDMVDCIIQKSQSGVFVKFFINDFESQTNVDKLIRYKSKFLKIYNYSPMDDHMSALHAKVISVDGSDTIITSANLSYHGQEGNIELGTYVKSTEIAKQIDNLFTQLIFKKVFTEIN